MIAEPGLLNGVAVFGTVRSWKTPASGSNLEVIQQQEDGAYVERELVSDD